MSRKITEVETIYIHLDSDVRLMENALRQARTNALIRFGIDEYGHSDKVKDWSRSDCSIEIEFVGIRSSGGMGGWQHTVEFKTWCETYEEEET